MYRTLLFCGIALILWGGQTPTPPPATKTTPPPKPTRQSLTLPLSLWRGVPTIEAYVNGEPRDEFFVLATGMNGILLSPKSAERHKLTLSTDKSQCTLFDRRIEGNSVALKSIQIGGTRLENLTATVADPNQISHTGVNIEQAPVGWLGTPLLSQFQVTFRFAIHSVTFEDAKAPLPKTAETTLIPFTLKEGRIMIKAEIEGAKPFSAILDTGTPGVLIPASVGATLRTTGQKLLSIRHASGTKGQAIQNRAPVLRVGDTELRGIGVVYISPDSPAEFDRNFAVLGMSFLRYFKVTINYAKQRIALTPVTADTGEAQP